MLKFHRLLLTAGTFLDRPAFVLAAMTPEACKRIAGGELADDSIVNIKAVSHAVMYGAAG